MTKHLYLFSLFDVSCDRNFGRVAVYYSLQDIKMTYFYRQNTCTNLRADEQFLRLRLRMTLCTPPINSFFKVDLTVSPKQAVQISDQNCKTQSLNRRGNLPVSISKNCIKFRPKLLRSQRDSMISFPILEVP
jgi:hypothetical protein